MEFKYKRCLLKISGEALGGVSIYDPQRMQNIVKQIITLSQEGIEIAVVVGGGNIWRGVNAKIAGLDKVNADYMGMLATVMNALALEAEFKNQNFDKVIIQSSIEMNKICEPYYFKKCLSRLSKGYVVILAAGTGYPYFTTDTAAALRAAEIKADVLLMAKNGVDGVYSADPKIDNTATHYKFLTYEDITQKQLRVMDLTAITMSMEANLKIIVFDINKPDNIVKALQENTKITIISSSNK
ncbi:UMP kinase [Spiroplasma endosymbiont of Clivina fossor]|uniref:UMP kinase n=1 Tax=Spiroplasma endosymbiont of Clivina fossor TaxID=3066282 RepID=UPI00313ED9D0